MERLTGIRAPRAEFARFRRRADADASLLFHSRMLSTDDGAYNFVELLCDSTEREESLRAFWSPFTIHRARTASYKLACSLSRANKHWHAAVRLYRSTLRTLAVNDLDDAGLALIAKDCQQLRKFSFHCSLPPLGYDRRMLSDAAVLAFFAACPLLETVCLGECFGSMAARTMLLLSRSVSHVSELDLSGCYVRNPVNPVQCNPTSTSVSSFLTGCGQLSKLSLDGLPCITDELVRCIEPLHPKLCVLHLCRVPISDACFNSYDWPRLKELSLSSEPENLTMNCFTGAHFPSLVALDVEAEVERLLRLTPLVTACPSLLGLRIGGANKEAGSLSDLVLPQLEMLDLSETGSWAPQAYAGLTAVNVPCLASVSLAGGEYDPKVTSRTIQSIALCCPQLTELDCDYLEQIDDEAVMAVAKHCVGLKYLGISFSSVTDAALLACTGLSKLSYLNLSFVRDVTDAGLRTVAEACPLLWNLGHSVEEGLSEEDATEHYASTWDGYRAVCKDVLRRRARGHAGDILTQHLVFRRDAAIGHRNHSFLW